MEIYLVGGAVRDELLGRPIEERDWVVVGGTAEELLRRGYRQVGRDFPVFLDPETHEEYALARTERKTGPGHTGFETYAGGDVTLEADLRRRDLTINAMARAADGTIIDPWGGQQDLASRTLRHVSEAFAEDPLRVFRVARFAARLPDFSVAPQTHALMRSMCELGVVDELPAERVWNELDVALGTQAPARFFVVLAGCGGLAHWFPEVEPHVASLERLFSSFDEALDRFGALGRLLTVEEAVALGARLKVSRHHARLIDQVAHHGAVLADWSHQSARAVYAAMRGCAVLKDRAWFERVMRIVGTDLGALAEVVCAVDSRELRQHLRGKALGAALDASRIDAIERFKTSVRS